MTVVTYDKWAVRTLGALRQYLHHEFQHLVKLGECELKDLSVVVMLSFKE